MSYTNSGTYGVINGVRLKDDNRRSSLNGRIFSRHHSNKPLEARFSMRPVCTKRTLMPILDERKPHTVSINTTEIHDTTTNFYPGSRTAPWSGMMDNIDTESEIRNQNSVLSRGDCKTTYVPPSNSDLYIHNIPVREPALLNHNPHSLLEHTNNGTFYMSNPNTLHVGNDTFYNHTRQQRVGVNGD
jgi:hypothetical protein